MRHRKWRVNLPASFIPPSPRRPKTSTDPSFRQPARTCYTLADSGSRLLVVFRAQHSGSNQSHPFRHTNVCSKDTNEESLRLVWDLFLFPQSQQVGQFLHAISLHSSRALNLRWVGLNSSPGQPPGADLRNEKV